MTAQAPFLQSITRNHITKPTVKVKTIGDGLQGQAL